MKSKRHVLQKLLSIRWPSIGVPSYIALERRIKLLAKALAAPGGISDDASHARLLCMPYRAPGLVAGGDERSGPLLLLPFLVLLSLLISGCAPSFRITGRDPNDPTWTRGQSETAIAAGYGNYYGYITVAYNDDTGNESTVLYPPGSRRVLAGASLMGWSYSTDRGQTWQHGTKVAPSPSFPVLWGDPAIATFVFDPKFVFMSNLAVAASKFPPGGITGPLVNPNGSSPIGGACIARSGDGGVTFGLQQCVFTRDLDFYDGGSMASSIHGEVFAGFVNVTRNRIDIWRSPAADGVFTLMPDPFPGHAMITHPRLRVELVSGDLYAMARDNFGTLYINRFAGGQWQQPRVAGTGAQRYPNVALSDRTLRTGPQFSFDIGAPFIDDGRDAVRVLYTVQNAGGLHVVGSMCYADLRSDCFPAPGWTTDFPGDQFNPNMRAFSFLWMEPAWKATFVSRDSDPVGNTVLVHIADLQAHPDGSHALTTARLLDPQVPCPDTRSTGGYWGDYNDLQFIGADRGSGVARFLYTFSDSTAGCVARETFTSTHVHVQGVIR